MKHLSHKKLIGDARVIAQKVVNISDDEPIEKIKTGAREAGVLDTVVGVMKSPLGRAIGKEVVRGVFGLLGGTPTRRRKRGLLW